MTRDEVQSVTWRLGKPEHLDTYTMNLYKNVWILLCGEFSKSTTMSLVTSVSTVYGGIYPSYT